MTFFSVRWVSRRRASATSPAVCPAGSLAALRISWLYTPRVGRHRPYAAQEAVDAVDPGRAPRPALVPRAHEHQEQAHRVRAVARDELVGILDVAARLAHALAVGAQDLALVEQPLPRLALVDQTQVVQRLGEETCVHQVQDRMLGAACVLLDRAPHLVAAPIDRPVFLFGRQVAPPIPGRVDERVHRVRLAPARAAALRTRGAFHDDSCVSSGLPCAGHFSMSSGSVTGSSSYGTGTIPHDGSASQ